MRLMQCEACGLPGYQEEAAATSHCPCPNFDLLIDLPDVAESDLILIYLFTAEPSDRRQPDVSMPLNTGHPFHRKERLLGRCPDVTTIT